MEGSVINQICASMDSFFDTEKNRRLYRQESQEGCGYDSWEAGKGVRCQRGLGVEIL